MTDERYKAIMDELGQPNSHSLLAAMRQVENEVAHEMQAAERERLRIEVLRAQIRCGITESGGMTIGSFDMSMLDAFKA